MHFSNIGNIPHEMRDITGHNQNQDNATLTKLKQPVDTLEKTNPHRDVLGLFTPPKNPDTMLVNQLIKLSEQEIMQEVFGNGWYPIKGYKGQKINIDDLGKLKAKAQEQIDTLLYDIRFGNPKTPELYAISNGKETCLYYTFNTGYLPSGNGEYTYLRVFDSQFNKVTSKGAGS